MATEIVMVKVSPAYKEHVSAYAKEAGISLSELMRRATARETGYDLEGIGELAGRGRPKKYVSEEARKEAVRARTREREEHKRKVVAAVMKQERIEGAAALEKWLIDHGIPLDDSVAS